MEGYRFSNWAGTHSCRPELYFEPTTVAEIQQIIKKAKEVDKRVKVQGYGHSPNDIACGEEYMIHLKKMAAVLNVDEQKRQVTVQAGCSLKALSVDILPKYNMALPVCPSVGEPTIAGAISCGTHASGKRFGVLGSYVTTLKLLTADANILSCSEDDNRDIFRAAVCSIGCLGIIVEITLQCHEAFYIHSISKPSTVDKILSQLDTFLDDFDHGKLFWYPHTEKVIVYQDKRTKEQPIRNDLRWFWDGMIGYQFHQFSMWIGYLFPRIQPLINKMFSLLSNITVEKVDTSYNLFTFNCYCNQEATEWAIPLVNDGPLGKIDFSFEGADICPQIAYITLEKTADVVRELKSRISLDPQISAHFPVEVRFVKGDNALISPCHGRDSCFINIIHYRPYGMKTSNPKYWKLFEDIVRKAGGRPHWGKCHDVTGEEFHAMYPEWDKFCTIRQEMDPHGMFLNQHLERIFGINQQIKKN